MNKIIWGTLCFIRYNSWRAWIFFSMKTLFLRFVWYFKFNCLFNFRMTEATLRSLGKYSLVKITYHFNSCFGIKLFAESMLFSILKLPFINRLFCLQLPLSMILSLFQQPNIILVWFLHPKFTRFLTFFKNSFINSLLIQ